MVMDSKFIQTMPCLREVLLKVRLMAGVEVLHLKVKFFKDPLYLTLCVVRVCTNGLMDAYILELFKQVKKPGRVYTCGQMDKHTKENLKVTIVTVLVFYITLTENDMKVCGKMERNMEEEAIFGRMAQDSHVFILTERRKKRASSKVQQYQFKI